MDGGPTHSVSAQVERPIIPERAGRPKCPQPPATRLAQTRRSALVVESVGEVVLRSTLCARSSGPGRITFDHPATALSSHKPEVNTRPGAHQSVSTDDCLPATWSPRRRTVRSGDRRHRTRREPEAQSDPHVASGEPSRAVRMRRRSPNLNAHMPWSMACRGRAVRDYPGEQRVTPAMDAPYGRCSRAADSLQQAPHCRRPVGSTSAISDCRTIATITGIIRRPVSNTTSPDRLTSVLPSPRLLSE